MPATLVTVGTARMSATPSTKPNAATIQAGTASPATIAATGYDSSYGGYGIQLAGMTS